VQRRGNSTLILFLGGAVLFVDMFLRWLRNGEGSFVPYRATGWELPLMTQAATLGLALALVELTRIRGIWWTRTSALLGFFLASGAALMTIGGLIHLHWGGYTGLKFSRYGYGAWIALAVAVALLAGAVLRLTEERVGATA
jgi:hypothetical protein